MIDDPFTTLGLTSTRRVLVAADDAQGASILRSTTDYRTWEDRISLQQNEHSIREMEIVRLCDNDKDQSGCPSTQLLVKYYLLLLVSQTNYENMKLIRIELTEKSMKRIDEISLSHIPVYRYIHLFIYPSTSSYNSENTNNRSGSVHRMIDYCSSCWT